MDRDKVLRKISPSVWRVESILHEAGHSTWLVGGAIRDILMGRPVHDWDLATTATVQDMMTLFRRRFVYPKGTVLVQIDGQDLELTPLRGETIIEDLRQRDFTINALAFDLRARTLLDPLEGRSDISRGIIRFVGDPIRWFEREPFYAVRAARFSAVLGMDLHSTLQEVFTHLSVDGFNKTRFGGEWLKAFESSRPSRFLRILDRCQLLSSLFSGYRAFDFAKVDRGRTLPERLALFLTHSGCPNFPKAMTLPRAVLTPVRRWLRLGQYIPPEGSEEARIYLADCDSSTLSYLRLLYPNRRDLEDPLAKDLRHRGVLPGEVGSILTRNLELVLIDPYPRI